MGRRTYVCVGYTPRDEALVSRTKEEGLALVQQPLMLLRRMGEYLSTNPPPADFSEDRIIEDFIASMMSERYLEKRHRAENEGSWDGVQAGTAGNYLALIERYGIRPGRLEEAAGKIHHLAFKKGLERLALLDVPRRARAYPTPKEMLDIIRSPPERGPDYEEELSRHVFWYLLVATGGRPTNLRIGEPRISKAEVGIKWISRKSKRNDVVGDTSYPFEWTAPPPPHVATALHYLAYRWGELGARAWWHCEVSNMPQFINNWLQNKGAQTGGTKWTSTTPRNVLSTILMKRTEAGEMTEHAFTWAMDHTLQTAQRNYVNMRLYGEHPPDSDKEDQ